MPSIVDDVKISPQELQSKWRDGPIQFSKDFFSSTLWAKQEEIMLSVRDNPRTTVRSCNSGGKSKVAAEIVLWFLLSHYPSKVIITAPTFLQVEKILWKEIAALYHKSVVPIGGDLLATELKLNDEWFALGISTDEVNRFQGFKSPHLLIVMDEALGINPIIWEAVEGLLPYRILAMANPLAPEGEFFKTFSSSLWNKISISAQDAIDWQKVNGDIPGLVNQQWVSERKEEWGEKSPLYQSRVLGEFPQEWTNAVVSLIAVNRSRNIKIEVEEDDVVKVLAIDVASKHGDNLTVFTYRHNNKIKKIVPKPTYSMIDIANTVKQDLVLGDADTIVIDSDGLGEGLGDIFDNYHIPYLAFHGGPSSKPIEITGTVVVRGDVIIKGVIKGQGVIYEGRNISVAKDITYKNAPGSPRPSSNNPDALDNWVMAQKDKDLVGFAAKESIILGDYTSRTGGSWYANSYLFNMGDEDVGQDGIPDTHDTGEGNGIFESHYEDLDRDGVKVGTIQLTLNPKRLGKRWRQVLEEVVGTHKVTR